MMSLPESRYFLALCKKYFSAFKKKPFLSFVLTFVELVNYHFVFAQFSINAFHMAHVFKMRLFLSSSCNILLYNRSLSFRNHSNILGVQEGGGGFLNALTLPLVASLEFLFFYFPISLPFKIYPVQCSGRFPSR